MIDPSKPEELEVEYLSPDDLTPHPDNYRSHPPEQIENIKQSIRQHGFYKNIVAARDRTILAGHGVVHASSEMPSIDEVPVYLIDIDPHSAAARKIIVGDNEISKGAGESEELLADLLTKIKEEDEDLEGSGYDDADLKDLMDELGRGEPQDADWDTYEQKVQTPTYRPKGDRPLIDDLYDATKAKQLLKEIDEADVPEELVPFLRAAAYRHVVFHFDMIAEYYAHASPEVQELFEASALVIIDFDEAVEQGFVEMSDDMRDILQRQADRRDET